MRGGRREREPELTHSLHTRHSHTHTRLLSTALQTGAAALTNHIRVHTRSEDGRPIGRVKWGIQNTMDTRECVSRISTHREWVECGRTAPRVESVGSIVLFLRTHCVQMHSDRQRVTGKAIHRPLSTLALSLDFRVRPVVASCDSSPERSVHESKLMTFLCQSRHGLRCEVRWGAMDTRACTHTASSERPYRVRSDSR